MSNIVTLAHYSNNDEVITNPAYKGVTTVWLLSTLGSTRQLNISSSEGGSFSSVLKKKDIINVSIPNTCEVIRENNLDLPLRYVSNLMYGVAICYHRKTEYVLNDLTNLLTQVQRKFYVVSASRKKYDNKSKHVATIFDAKETDAVNGLLNDDPLFDINQINSIAAILEPSDDQAISEAMIIRRQDYLNELTNANDYDELRNAKNSSEFLRRPVTLDDIPIDVDFNFELDDSINQEGTSCHSKTSAGRSDSDLELNYRDQEFKLNFDENARMLADETGIDLGVDQLEEEEASFEDENTDAPNGLPPIKKLENSRLNKSFYQTIQVDGRTGLSTDTLRNNHNTYCETMDFRNRKKRKISPTADSDWQSLMGLDDATHFMKNCWTVLFCAPDEADLSLLGSKSSISGNYSIERGRRRSRLFHSERPSSSVSSAELGRRAVAANDMPSEPAHDLLLNLEQIEEELAENNSTSQSDLMHINLDLPPSSFGRVATRDSGAGSESKALTSGSHDLDVVDELYSQIRGYRRSNEREETGTVISANSREYSSERQSLISGQGTVILDSHTRRFYDYIRERSSYVGKTTWSHPPFKKKLLFEDIVPSTLTTELDADRTSHVKVTDQKIAASAFLSLLNLASRSLITVEEFPDHGNGSGRFDLMKPDDIVVYA
ncbi:hypothetical protein HG537_0B06160 [Torulaspora globosa]|uniref:Rad21/Rec8-like protein N-terminal domain-containing protein n=1 Tax=Torulaspora globosa TaxID=48254 RepID=A0A7H9HNC7_9SACH|nr:hypothetical protein HG537_0B06160 [Torulaspora sp. CBS 2947]